MPLTDITNIQRCANLPDGPGPGLKLHDLRQVGRIGHRHNPYDWQCLIEETPSEVFMEAELRVHTYRSTEEEIAAAESMEYDVPDMSSTLCHSLTLDHASEELTPTVVISPLHTALVEFKCHADEYRCVSGIAAGQYVVVSGDRGIDVGVVTRVTDTAKLSTHTVEKAWPSREVLRRATQREVDFWAFELKEMEESALKTCQKMVHKVDLLMEVVQAEYQFDCKKLTFYYTAQSRVDFVQLIKDLYREFGCRIWMEKVRTRDV